jgi:DNA-binding transcriptional MocR family regulator
MNTDWLPQIGEGSGPTYARIVDSLRADIHAGKLTAGTRLPAHRSLARRLGVSLGTVTRAYAAARGLNLVSGEPGRGVFVSAFPPVSADAYPTPAQSGPYLDLRLNQPAIDPDGGAISRCLASLARTEALSRIQDYDFAPGALAYRVAAARWLSHAGVTADPGRIILSNGAQQGLFAAIAALARAGDTIALEGLNYPGLRQIASHLRIDLAGVAVDSEGMVPEDLERVLRPGGIRLIVCTPRGHNPTAACMSAGRLGAILEVADRHGITVIEDDVYGPLFGNHGETLHALSGGRTVYVGSLSKVLAPGLRLGFIVAPPAALEAITGVVRASTWSSSTLSAEFLLEFNRKGLVEESLNWHRNEIRTRCAIASEVLSDFGLATAPGCYHVWLKIPEPLAMEDLIATARDHGLLLTDSAVFQMSGDPSPRSIRLSLGRPAGRAVLRAGLARLAMLLKTGRGPSAWV